MPCTSLLIVNPTMGEIETLSDLTVREILANNDVITTACPKVKK